MTYLELLNECERVVESISVCSVVVCIMCIWLFITYCVLIRSHNSSQQKLSLKHEVSSNSYGRTRPHPASRARLDHKRLDEHEDFYMEQALAQSTESETHWIELVSTADYSLTTAFVMEQPQQLRREVWVTRQ